ncbi:MAG: purine-nucleoside phosphorylase [Rhodobacteraceae bacterium]|nr:purine-nucleoside phosphorylase [Paracoccaceae bacterium]
MKPGFHSRADKAVASLRRKTDFQAEIALVTGTGLAGLLDEIDVEMTIPYAQIEGFPVSTAPSHKGELVLGRLAGQPVIAQNGRFHLYEGWEADDVVFPVYVLRALGASSYVVTNAAGALNADYHVGDVMLIEDHMNFMGVHPLAGPNEDSLGPRFPDMSRAYDPDLRAAARASADALGLTLRSGIYAGVHGPEFETSAERRFLRASGGDAVGMSTVPEVICAGHAGMRVLGFSAITNAATGNSDQQPDTLEEVLENAQLAAVKIRAVVLRMIKESGL